MTTHRHKFLQALEELESNVGLDETAQFLSEALLVTSCRLNGDNQTCWSVNTPLVSGEVAAITEKGLSKKSLKSPIVTPSFIAKYNRLIIAMDAVIINEDTHILGIPYNNETFIKLETEINQYLEMLKVQGTHYFDFVISNLNNIADKIELFITPLDIIAIGQKSFFIATYTDEILYERKRMLNAETTCGRCCKPFAECNHSTYALIEAFDVPEVGKPRLLVCTPEASTKDDVFHITRYALINLMANVNKKEIVWERYDLTPYYFEDIDYSL